MLPHPCQNIILGKNVIRSIIFYVFNLRRRLSIAVKDVICYLEITLVVNIHSKTRTWNQFTLLSPSPLRAANLRIRSGLTFSISFGPEQQNKSSINAASFRFTLAYKIHTHRSSHSNSPEWIQRLQHICNHFDPQRNWISLRKVLRLFWKSLKINQTLVSK